MVSLGLPVRSHAGHLSSRSMTAYEAKLESAGWFVKQVQEAGRHLAFLSRDQLPLRRLG